MTPPRRGTSDLLTVQDDIWKGVFHSNKECNITKTTFGNNSYRAWPSSHVSTRSGYLKNEFDIEYKDVEARKIKIMNTEEPINLCLPYVEDNKPFVN